MALPANQLAGRIPDSYIHMWAASLLRGKGTSLKYWYVQLCSKYVGRFCTTFNCEQGNRDLCTRNFEGIYIRVSFTRVHMNVVPHSTMNTNGRTEN